MVIVIYFFFFKQKTAYEMRISDWSSDVCSSNLEQRRAASGHGAVGAGFHPLCRTTEHGALGPGRLRAADRTPRRRIAGAHAAGSDRKSVVEGKSVSVRVDLGGRRSIKKKKKKQYENDPV